MSFDVAEPHAVHAAQAFEDKKYGEERPAAHKAAEKRVRPVHAEGEDGGGHGQHCPAERDAVGKDEAFQIDARGDDEHSREHEIDGKGKRGGPKRHAKRPDVRPDRSSTSGYRIWMGLWQRAHCPRSSR